MRVQAVLFDMDGTLTDSLPATVRSWTTWAVEHDVTAEQLADQHGVPAADIVAALFDEDRRAAALARINHLELHDTDGVTALPGAAEALATLPAGRVAIVTSSGRALCRARLAAAGLPEPAVIITADDVTRGKPDPEPFLTAAAALGVDPGQCLVAEDAPAGIAAAKAAGCTALGLLTTVPAAELSQADAVVATLADLEWQVDDSGIAVDLA